MQNEVTLQENGIITVVDHGIQTKDVLVETEVTISAAIDRLRSQAAPVLILIDVTDMQGQTAESRKFVKELFDRLDFDKAAAFGTSIFLKYLINFLISMSGKKEKLRYFDNAEAATDWLMESHPAG